MLGLQKPDIMGLFQKYRWVGGRQLSTDQLIDLIAQVITENNETIEQQLIDEGVIKRK